MSTANPWNKTESDVRRMDIADKDFLVLKEKEASYGSSWKKRGGVGAFMMLARKWDRLENFLENAEPKWDVLHHGVVDTREEGILDDIRDLRRYLILVEEEILLQKKQKNLLEKARERVKATKSPETLSRDTQPTIFKTDPVPESSGMRQPFGYQGEDF